MAVVLDSGDRVASVAFRCGEAMPAARELAADVDVEGAAWAVTEDIMTEVWPDREDPTFYDAVHLSVLGNLHAIFDVIAGRGGLDTVSPAALEFAEVAARVDVPITELERAYRIGVASLWSWWSDIARARADSDEQPFDELICGPTLMIHDYVDRALRSIIARYEEVSCELHRTHRDQRRLILTQILDGSIDEATDELNGTLDYGLGDTHLALLLQTADPRPPIREIAELRDAADARATLMLQHGARSWIVWLGRSAAFEPLHVSRLQRTLKSMPFTITVGEPGAGLGGLRRTRQQALEAARVQRALGASRHQCLWAREVRLETMLLGDEQRARRFLADELGQLAAPDVGTRRLRETLLAWMATGSHVGAAAMLGIHENTVRNRIRAAETLLGTPLLGLRTELQVALRLERVLSASDALQGEKAA
jgi:regulator of protease activity HflC (stomatin/prohibitin superfamily)